MISGPWVHCPLSSSCVLFPSLTSGKARLSNLLLTASGLDSSHWDSWAVVPSRPGAEERKCPVQTTQVISLFAEGPCCWNLGSTTCFRLVCSSQSMENEEPFSIYCLCPGICLDWRKFMLDYHGGQQNQSEHKLHLPKSWLLPLKMFVYFTKCICLHTIADSRVHEQGSTLLLSSQIQDKVWGNWTTFTAQHSMQWHLGFISSCCLQLTFPP